jgi:hypothetical protein
MLRDACAKRTGLGTNARRESLRALPGEQRSEHDVSVETTGLSFEMTHATFSRLLATAALTIAVSCTRQGPEAPNGNGAGGSTAPDAAAVPTEFEEALQEYTGIVNLLGTMPPVEEAEAIRRALALLTAAIEHMPTPADPARSEAVKLLKSNDYDVWLAFERGSARAAEVRESLDLAASVLHSTARQLSPQAPRFEQAVVQFEQAATAIDPKESVRAERPKIIRALGEALTALEAIRSSPPSMKDAGPG